MKNMKIEALIKKINAVADEFGNDSEEMKKLDKEYEGAWMWIRAYNESNEKGFDEIVITDCIYDGAVVKMIETAKQLGINWFVFATGFSSAFETIDTFVQNGAKVGKFVVKEYEARRFGKDETIRVPGFRINF